MSVFANVDDKVIVQGITGFQGQKHTARMLECGTKIVGGVNPKKAGSNLSFMDYKKDFVDIPVFASSLEAVQKTGAKISVVFVPPAFVKEAVIDAIRAKIELVVIITEGIPIADTIYFTALAKEYGVQILGPNCPGMVSFSAPKDPNCNLGISCNLGIIPNNITSYGKLGLVSKSGTLTYQMMSNLSSIGFTSAIGIGGDPCVGTSHIDALKAFEADSQTEAIVLIGEIGGNAEEMAAEYIKDDIKKPVFAYIAGFSAPEGKTMGHAGAIISAGLGTAESKQQALIQAGVHTGRTPSETAKLVQEYFS